MIWLDFFLHILCQLSLFEFLAVVGLVLWRIYPPLNYLLIVTVICTFHFDYDITVVAMCYIGFCRNEFGA